VDPETAAARAKRERSRVLFGSVADLYDETRSGYPPELIDALVETTGLRAGDAVLEIGCGTGQLTRQLVPLGVHLTAIDLAPEMVALAATRVDAPVRFEVTPFEDLDAPAHSLRLITSATAFHWLDPAVTWTKVVRLLEPGGWLAVLETVEVYDEPIGAAVRQLWVDRSDDGGAWLRKPRRTVDQQIPETGLFEPPVVRAHAERRTMPAEQVVRLELTRATSLGYEPAVRASFTAELRAVVEPLGEIGLEQVSTLTMARARLPQS
jgi:ubiquinone/menaquinone biosynthesis C-methylase UbiE